ncbi:CERS5 [Hepatospora eriocheir]|uniref:CERS5 n=1 Tax=Hepatospora eriocheir TaxID=1081669 RepID=A0A1X0QAF0_9MICR|nr:CERS5 [Hepatospora eriocheir]
MIIHHSFTLCLLAFSYKVNLTRFGIAIMALHNISDPFLNLAKLFYRLKMNVLNSISGFIFAITFIVPRLYIFPFIVIKQAFKSTINNKVIRCVILSSLIILQVLHVIWTSMIVKIAFRMIIG